MKRYSYIPGARCRAEDTKIVTQGMSDIEALMVPSLFIPWDATTGYLIGDRVRYGETLYRCIQAHTAQKNWAPADSPSLWVRMDDPAIEWPVWMQPFGANDAYALGAKVTHNTKRWVSITDANVWEPGTYGWEET